MFQNKFKSFRAFRSLEITRNVNKLITKTIDFGPKIIQNFNYHSMMCLTISVIAWINLICIMSYVIQFFNSSRHIPIWIKSVLVLQVLPACLLFKTGCEINFWKRSKRTFDCELVISKKKISKLRLVYSNGEKMMHCLLVELAFTAQLLILIILNRFIPNLFEGFGKKNQSNLIKKIYFFKILINLFMIIYTYTQTLEMIHGFNLSSFYLST